MPVHSQPPPGQDPLVEQILSSLSIGFFFFLMLGLGCSIRFGSFKDRLRHPRAVFIGMMCQFIFMPFVTWLVAVTFGLDSYSAAALCIVGTCPGGALSNMLAYVIKADLTLSVAMTTASSAAAFFMLPLNLKFYLDILGVGEGSRLKLADLNIEWSSILLSTGIVVSGTITGMTIRAKLARLAPIAEKFGLVCGIGTFGVTFFQNRHSGAAFSMIDLKLLMAVIVPTVSGMALGLTLGRLAKVSKSSSVAIGIESSLQNGVLALAIVQLSIGKAGETVSIPESMNVTSSDQSLQESVESETRGRAILVPILYTMVSSVFNICCGLLLWKLGWTDANAKARPLRDFRDDWVATGSIRKAVSMSHERLKSMHIEPRTGDENATQCSDGNDSDFDHEEYPVSDPGCTTDSRITPRSESDELTTSDRNVNSLTAISDIAIGSPKAKKSILGIGNSPRKLKKLSPRGHAIHPLSLPDPVPQKLAPIVKPK